MRIFIDQFCLFLSNHFLSSAVAVVLFLKILKITGRVLFEIYMEPHCCLLLGTFLFQLLPKGEGHTIFSSDVAN